MPYPHDWQPYIDTAIEGAWTAIYKALSNPANEGHYWNMAAAYLRRAESYITLE